MIILMGAIKLLTAMRNLEIKPLQMFQCRYGVHAVTHIMLHPPSNRQL